MSELFARAEELEACPGTEVRRYYLRVTQASRQGRRIGAVAQNRHWYLLVLHVGRGDGCTDAVPSTECRLWWHRITVITEYGTS